MIEESESFEHDSMRSSSPTSPFVSRSPNRTAERRGGKQDDDGSASAGAEEDAANEAAIPPERFGEARPGRTASAAAPAEKRAETRETAGAAPVASEPMAEHQHHLGTIAKALRENTTKFEEFAMLPDKLAASLTGAAFSEQCEEMFSDVDGGECRGRGGRTSRATAGEIRGRYVCTHDDTSHPSRPTKQAGKGLSRQSSSFRRSNTCYATRT